MPQVSVIVTSYNLGAYLGETLRSVSCQTFTDWECLVVDNGSSDNSLVVAREFAAGDPRFRVEEWTEERGVASARTRGLELACGRYILFLDADDLLSERYMEDAVAALEADPELTLVYGQAQRFGMQSSWDLPPFSMETMLARNCLYVSCFFPKRLAVPFDTAFVNGYEDWDFWLTLLEAEDNPKVLQLPYVCFHYRTRPRSRNRGVTDEALTDIRRRLWEKHRSLYARYFCDPLQTVEYRRLQSSFRKASRWSLVWKLRLLYRKLFG